ncbi:hypothetical protein PV661_17565 [Streptomyces sp. MD20-1-1]|jgi:hypothetical protein|uniref:hypothetical protein n=1 Tax=Streptomyces sp. MD20-1-1 TaxID=3028668 RepID=UPI0029A82502|nr:hypothetical protein [Streptomyces sp. MD20-1-1]WTC19083.1 hypothetical protein OH709_26035 [Streptomyces cellulosae]
MINGASIAARESAAGVGIGGIAFLFVLMIGLLVVISLIAYLCSSAARRKELPRGRLRYRAGVVLSSCAAICVYLWGLLHMPSDEAVYLRKACADAGGEERASRVDGYETSYVPLRFVCRVDGDGGFSTIPSWINPTVGVLCSLALITAAASATRAPTGHRSKQTTPKGNSNP